MGWATCVTMTLQDLDGASGSCTSLEQSIVQEEIDKSCDTSCPSGKCDVGGNGYQIAHAINKFEGGGDYSYSNQALSEDDPEGYSIKGGYSAFSSYSPSYLPSARCSWFG